MKAVLVFVRDSLVRGVFLLVPIVVLGMLIQKVFDVMQKLVAPVAHRLGALTGIATPALLAIVLLVLICFLAGLLSRNAKSKVVIGWLESTVLVHIPGYAYMKGMGENMAGVESLTSYQPVLARIEDSWQIGFVVETIEAGQHAVYVPGAPNPWSGSVYFMAEDRIRRIDVRLAEAQGCLKRLGIGSGALLRGKL